MKRVALSVATNLAILVSLAGVVRVTGFDQWISHRGLGLHALPGFALVCGFGGAFISLARSRWLALRSTGARIIEAPGAEVWVSQEPSRWQSAVSAAIGPMRVPHDSTVPSR